MTKVFGFCIAAGLFMIIGSVGSAELGILDMGGFVARGVIGLALLAVGYIGLEALSSKSLNKRRPRK